MGVEDQYGEVNANLDICCPRCKSRNVIAGFKDGYFWIEECKNCGYRGRDGDVVGCVV